MSNNDPKISQYQRIVDAIKADMTAGILTPGDRLPAIAALCKKYGVSNNTICAALRCLGDEGYVKSRRGSGVYVQERRPQNNREKGNNTIALVLACSASYDALPFEGAMVKGIIEQGRKDDYHVIVTDSNKGLDNERELLHKLASEVAGLIIMPTAEGVNYVAYRELRDKQIPFVFIDRAAVGIVAPSVTTDNEHVGYLATRHLLEIGCRRICAFGSEHSLTCQERLNGYRKALEEFEIEFDPGLMHYFVPSIEETQAIFLENVERNRRNAKDGNPEPVGVFAINEYVASHCYQCAAPLGLNIPHDISVVGVDDVFASFLQPQLSTIRQEPYKMGEYATQVLVRMLSTGETDHSEQIRIMPELIVRESTVPSHIRKFSSPLVASATKASAAVHDTLTL